MGVASNRVDIHQAAARAERHVERVAEPLRDDAGKVRRSALRAARLAGS